MKHDIKGYHNWTFPIFSQHFSNPYQRSAWMQSCALLRNIRRGPFSILLSKGHFNGYVKSLWRAMGNVWANLSLSLWGVRQRRRLIPLIQFCDTICHLCSISTKNVSHDVGEVAAPRTPNVPLSLLDPSSMTWRSPGWFLMSNISLWWIINKQSKSPVCPPWCLSSWFLYQGTYAGDKDTWASYTNHRGGNWC